MRKKKKMDSMGDLYLLYVVHAMMIIIKILEEAEKNKVGVIFVHRDRV